jgi:MYXO-CTERM domain-containing protein
MPQAPDPWSFGCSVAEGQGSGLFALGLFIAALALVRRRRVQK